MQQAQLRARPRTYARACARACMRRPVTTCFQWVLYRNKEFLVAIEKASSVSHPRFGCRDRALGSRAVCVATQIFGSRRWYSSVRLESVK